MRYFLIAFFVVYMVILGCKNPTATESHSTIEDGTATLPSLPELPDDEEEVPEPPVLSGLLSLTSNDSTQLKGRTLDWSGLSYASETANGKYEIAIGFDDDSDGFDAGDQNNILDWSEPPTSLAVTSYQVVDGTDSLALTLKSGVGYYYSIRATDTNDLTSNVVSSASWETLEVPQWYSSNANWLDAADLDSLFLDSGCSVPAPANGAAIKCWQDKSGTGTHAIDSAAAGDPLNMAPGLNGLNVVDFNGGQGLLMAGNPAFTSSLGYTLFVVLIQDGNAANQTVYRGRPNGAHGTQAGISFEITNNQYQNVIYEDTGGNSLGISVLGAIATTPIIQRLDFGNGGTPFEIFQNGTNTLLTPNTVIGAAPSGPVTNPTVALGYNAASNDRYLRGQIAEVILYNQALESSEKEAIEGYLACKWGLQATLPGLHPYATACP